MIYIYTIGKMLHAKNSCWCVHHEALQFPICILSLTKVNALSMGDPSNPAECSAFQTGRLTVWLLQFIPSQWFSIRRGGVGGGGSSGNCCSTAWGELWGMQGDRIPGATPRPLISGILHNRAAADLSTFSCWCWAHVHGTRPVASDCVIE